MNQVNTPLDIHKLIYKVQDALNLDESEYAENPSTNPAIPSESNRKIFRNHIAYRIIQDLKRGWRYVLPNLEQTALLDITYDSLETYCGNDKYWENIDLLRGYSTAERTDFVGQILNYFRTTYAVDFDMLRYENRLRTQDEFYNSLNKEKLWSLDKGEKIEAPNLLSLQRADKATRETFIQSIGSKSRLSRFIKHEFRKIGQQKMTGQEYDGFMTSLLDLLTDMHYLKKQTIKAEKGPSV